MFKFLEQQKFTIILLFLGIVLILGGVFEVKDITKLNISPHNETHYFIVILGAFFTLASILLHSVGELALNLGTTGKIKNIDNGVSAKLANAEINILYGKIELLASESEDSLVVLPANEFFDDECIEDNKSALGAYVNYKFTNQTETVKNLIAEELKGLSSKKVEKEMGIFQESYGIGCGLLLKKPLSSNQPVLLVSVTTKRVGEGLRSEMEYIFQAIKEIKMKMVDQRLESVYVPIMGSGHGGLKEKVALFSMLLAVCGAIVNSSGHHIKKFNIVVFQPSKQVKFGIAKSVAKRLLKLAIKMSS